MSFFVLYKVSFALFPAGGGKDEAFPQESPESSSKPKQLKFPNQVYIDLPLCRDEQQLQQQQQSPSSPGEAGVGVGVPGGELADDPYTTTSTSSASTTPQLTPTNSLKRASARRRTDWVLYGCGSLLAAVALGCDVREALRSSGDDGDPQPPPREDKEKKKKEGLFQRATRFRRSTSPPAGRSRRDEVPTAHSPAAAAPPAPVNLLSMSAIVECNSTRCLLQAEAAEPVGPAKADGPRTTADVTQTQSQPVVEQSVLNTGTRLRRKKYTNNHNSELFQSREFNLQNFKFRW